MVPWAETALELTIKEVKLPWRARLFIWLYDNDLPVLPFKFKI